MPTINPYLNFLGKTEEAFRFYQSVFGGEFTRFCRIGEVRNIPGGYRMIESDKEKIMLVSLPIGNGNVLMGTDALESMGHILKMGNNFSISIQADCRAEAERLFQALAQGGRVIMPLGRAFWGDYFGMLTDRYGIQWMVNYVEEKAARSLS